MLQLNDIPVFGSTYDPLHIVMYGISILLGILLDFTIIDNFEKRSLKDD
jgi:hypothetical protein